MIHNILGFRALFFCWMVLGSSLLRAQSPHQKAIQALNNGNFNAAQQLLEKSLHHDSTSLETWVLLTNSLLKNDQDAKAYETAKSGLQRLGPQADLIWLKGEAALRLQEYQEAYETLLPLLQMPQKSTYLKIEDKDLHARLVLAGQLYFRTLADEGAWQKAQGVMVQVVELQPKDLLNQKALVFSSIQLKNWRQAAAHSARALKGFPQDVDLLRMNVLANQQLEQYPIAFQALEQLIMLEPDDNQLIVLYVQLGIQTSKFEAAEQLLAKSLAAHPNEKSLYYAWANLASAKGADSIKIVIYTTIHEKFADDIEAAQALQQHFLQEKQCTEMGNWCDSLALRTSKITQYGLQKASGFLQCGDSISAEGALAGVHLDKPENDTVLFTYASFLRLSGKAAQARQVLEKSELRNRNPSLQELLGIVYFELGFQEKAQKVLEAFAKDYPTASSFRGRFYRAQLLQTTQPQKAFELYVAAIVQLSYDIQNQQETFLQGIQSRGNGFQYNQFEIAEFQANILFFENLSQSLPKLLPAEEVVQIWDTLLLLFPNSGGLQAMIGSYYFDLMQWPKAKQLYQKALENNPKLNAVHLNMGRIFEEEQNWAAAYLSYERARGLDPEARAVYEGLIRTSEKAGNLELLAQKWQIELRTKPSNLLLRSYLKGVYHKLNKFEEAAGL